METETTTLPKFPKGGKAIAEQILESKLWIRVVKLWIRVVKLWIRVVKLWIRVVKLLI